MAEIRLSEVIGPGFRELAGDVLRHGHTHYDLAGGRGSLKSSTVSLLVPLILTQHPDTHAMVVRKVANTMRESVFAQYQWAVEKLGMGGLWTARLSPMELVYEPTGQKIMFRGADDTGKFKSIKAPFGYIAVTHFEEKDQFAGRTEIDTILQSTMRGGPMFWNFESYNPPLSRDNWANLDSQIVRPDRLCHRSTYLDVPREWLGEAFLAEAEHKKNTDERGYRHIYLGECAGTGADVFERVEVRRIDDEEIDGFDRIFQGVDWGWFPDKFAFLRTAYDRAREKIFLLDELYVNRTPNAKTGAWIRDKGYMDYPITCDSAEPKSIADYRAMGLPARGAVKGPGSVDYGFKWLQGRTIVIDPLRTPGAHREIVSYEYERDRTGNIISGYPDKDDHAISALRYAYEGLFSRRGTSA